MRNSMLRFLLLSLLTACSVMGYGQMSPTAHRLSKIPDPLYLLNSSIIVNSLLSRINSHDIKAVTLYKPQDGPGPLKNISSSSLVDITYDKPVNSQPLTDLSAERGLTGPVIFVLNGNKLNAAQVAILRIAPEAIGQVQVKPASSTNSETIVSIQTAVSKKDDPTNDPFSKKARVMIR